MPIPEIHKIDLPEAGELVKTLAKLGLDGVDEKHINLANRLIGDPEDIIHTDKISLVERISASMCDFTICSNQAALFRSAYLYSADNFPGKYYRSGLIIVIDREPLGFVKLQGNTLFLSARTVKNSENKYPLVQGGVYAVRYNLLDNINKSVRRWRIRSMNKFEVNPRGAFRLSINRKTAREKNLFHRDLDFSERIDLVLKRAKEVYHRGKSTRAYELLVKSCS